MRIIIIAAHTKHKGQLRTRMARGEVPRTIIIRMVHIVDAVRRSGTAAASPMMMMRMAALRGVLRTTTTGSIGIGIILTKDIPQQMRQRGMPGGTIVVMIVMALLLRQEPAAVPAEQHILKRLHALVQMGVALLRQQQPRLVAIVIAVIVVVGHVQKCQLADGAHVVHGVVRVDGERDEGVALGVEVPAVGPDEGGAVRGERAEGRGAVAVRADGHVAV